MQKWTALMLRHPELPTFAMLCELLSHADQLETRRILRAQDTWSDVCTLCRLGTRGGLTASFMQNVVGRLQNANLEAGGHQKQFPLARLFSGRIVSSCCLLFFGFFAYFTCHNYDPPVNIHMLRVSTPLSGRRASPTKLTSYFHTPERLHRKFDSPPREFLRFDAPCIIMTCRVPFRCNSQ